MNQKSQSAMEYLMTYGWSILIIAVILGALAYLGVFNPIYFAPKANPGSCQVFRPNGAETSYDINLLGVCQGEVPEYVSQFNGQSSYIGFGNTLILNTGEVTVSAWVYINPASIDGYRHDVMDDSEGTSDSGNGGGFVLASPSESLQGEDIHFWVTINNPANWQYANTMIITNRWILVTGTYDKNYVRLFIDGQLKNSNFAQGVFLQPLGSTAIGSFQNGQQEYFNGMIVNVQLYNTSLDANSIMALYQEGIGGAPIDLQNLVGWWPLNGNANDYSGNGNNGVPTNVVYTNSWISSYNPP